MKHTFFFNRMSVMLLCVLCCTAGCGSDGNDNSTVIVTASPENGPTVQTAVSTAEQMLGLGSNVDVILTTLENQMKADPQVYDVEVQQENGSISMVFNDGETHTIWLADEISGSSGFADTVENMAYAPDSVDRSTDAQALMTLQQQAAGPGYYQMPASDKALLLNGYVLYHGSNGASKDPRVVLTDSTEVLEKMLSARGYKVDRPEATLLFGDNKTITIPFISVEDFENLTDYGIIVIETHGGSRKLKHPEESLGKENCGGFLSQYMLLTTEAVNSDNLKKYRNRDDVKCGRLAIHDLIIRERGKKPRLKGQFYQVTPNYIREYDKGTFFDNTLMVMNSCSAYNADSSSPMRDMFFDKSSKGACFLGWTGETLVSVMGRTSLNLFQLMTASNEELTVKKLEALKKSTPPQGGEFTALNMALLALKEESLLTDPKKGTTLELSKQDDENTNDLILMPHPLQVNHGSSGDYWNMTLYCAGQPTATVGSTEVFIKNIGGNGWEFSMPVGAYGDIVITDNGRKSIPRPLHRWKPQITVEQTCSTNNPSPFLHFTATATLQARATIDSWCFRDSVWNDPPPATFNTYWDIDGSNLAWKIDGSGTQVFDEGYSMFYQYNGSGLDSFEKADCSGSFSSFNGSTVSFQICCGNLPFNMTFRGSDGAGGQTDETFSFCATLFDTNVVPVLGAYTVTLEDDWTVEGGTYEDKSGVDPVTIHWNAFPADPPFDMNGEPR